MLSSDRRFETLNFAAPIGGRVRLVTTLVVLIIVAMIFMPAIVGGLGGPQPPTRFEWLGPSLALPIAGAVLLLAIVREYRIVGDELHVVRLGRVNRFPLAGLTVVETNREVMSHAWKERWGNDGLGAITGRFASRQLGTFEALLTDVERAVVLRWPERTLVISPDCEAFFIEAIRDRANLRG